MRKILCLLFLSIVSCSGSLEKKPESLIQSEKMVDIITQIRIAEAKVSSSNLPQDSALLYYQKAEQNIFKKNSVSKDQYDKSYQYYLKNIEQMDDIYAKVVDSLSLREAIKKID